MRGFLEGRYTRSAAWSVPAPPAGCDGKQLWQVSQISRKLLRQAERERVAEPHGHLRHDAAGEVHRVLVSARVGEG